MNACPAPSERRLDRRIPLGCAATIRSPGGATVAAECVELSIGGMTLRTSYVPGEGEVLEVRVEPPAAGGLRAPLVAHLQVKRCHALGEGRYEIGGAIVRVVE